MKFGAQPQLKSVTVYCHHHTNSYIEPKRDRETAHAQKYCHAFKTYIA